MANTKISDAEMEAMWQFVAERDGATVSQIAEFSGRARASIRDRLNRDSRFRDERTKGANVIFYAVARAPQVDETQPTASTQPADDVPVDVPLQYHLQMFAIIPAFIRRNYDTRIYISSPRMTSLG